MSRKYYALDSESGQECHIHAFSTKAERDRWVNDHLAREVVTTELGIPGIPGWRLNAAFRFARGYKWATIKL